MKQKENILSAYSFLAALTENQNDLYNHVYVPICKRALSLYSLKGNSHGTIDQIQTIIKNEYGIDVPILVVRKLTRAVANSMSRSQKRETKFRLYEDGNTFEIGKYDFTDLENKYRKGERQARAIQLAFEEYLKSEEISIDNIPSFTDFLNKNKRRLASFFKGKADLNGEPPENTYFYHVKFLEHISISSHDLYDIAENLYLGSIVASFLESGIDLDTKFSLEESYFIDTPIILRALDLQKEEETKPVLELLNLIRKTGGEINVLSITIDEVHGVINSAIEHYNNNTPTSTINEACVRAGKNKTHLIGLNGKLEERIIQELQVKVEVLPNILREKFQNSPDIKNLKEERTKKGSAIHDVLAYLFVRDKRGGVIQSYQKAKVWFLTTNARLLGFNVRSLPQHVVSEIVLPDALTSLLWLKNPNQLVGELKSIGLTELMANTLSEEIASKELISEFSNSIKQFDKVSDEDYHILLGSVAHQSAKKIEHFNELVANDKQSASIEVYRLIERERSRRVSDQSKVKEAERNERIVKEENKALNQRLTEIESKLKDTAATASEQKTQLESLSENQKKQKKLLRKFIIGLSVFVVLGSITFFGLKFYNRLPTYQQIITIFLGTSAIWGCGSFIINLVKFIKGK
jgi:hypothetical protein